MRHNHQYLWLEYKHDSSEKNWTVNYPQQHLSNRSWLFCLLSEPRSVDQIFWLAHRRLDNTVFRSLCVASVTVSHIKFEGRQSSFWKSQNRSRNCSYLQIVSITTQVDKEASALPPTCASGCISPIHAFCLRQKSCPVHEVQWLWCFDAEKLQLLQ